jgi:hypothetical protein
MEAYATPVSLDVFADSRARFESLVAMLSGAEAAADTHGDLEERLHAEGTELLRSPRRPSVDCGHTSSPRPGTARPMARSTLRERRSPGSIPTARFILETSPWPRR